MNLHFCKIIFVLSMFIFIAMPCSLVNRETVVSGKKIVISVCEGNCYHPVIFFKMLSHSRQKELKLLDECHATTYIHKKIPRTKKIIRVPRTCSCLK